MKLSVAALFLLLVVALLCILPTSSKGGRGGGGGRSSGGSRGSSSRGSSSSGSSSSSRGSSSSSSSSNRQSSSTDRRNSNKGSSHETPRKVQPSAPDLPETKPIVPKSTSVERQPAYNPNYAEAGKSSNVGNQPSPGNNRGNIGPESSLPLGSSNANAPPLPVGTNQQPGRSLNPPPNSAGPGQPGNPPPYGAGPGALGNPPPYGAGPGALGNPPPYGAGPGIQGNPPPYGAGPGHLGNPPPYSAGPGYQGNPPPYGAGPGHFGNPPPYGAGPGYQGNPPPYGAGPGYQGNPPPYGAGQGPIGNPSPYGAGTGNNPPPYGWNPGISGNLPSHGLGPGNIGQPSLGGQPSYGGAGNINPYGSQQSGYPNSFGGKQYGNRGGSGINPGTLFLGAAVLHGSSHNRGSYYNQDSSSIHSTAQLGYGPGERTPEKLKTFKRKGFLGSFLSLGHDSKESKTTKMYSIAYPNKQYSRHEPRKYGVSPLYALLPMKILQKKSKPYKPSKYVKHWFLPYGSRQRGWRRRSFFDLDYNDDNNFAGRRCYTPFAQKNGEINCTRTERGMHCNSRCNEGFIFPNNTVEMQTECWHFSGFWKPTRYLPECKPNCGTKCRNGGVCVKPGKCRCTAEYRGSECQYHFLQCNIRSLAGENKISWVCRHNIKETKCTVSCKPPQVFDTPPPKKYHCSANGTWTPDTMPNCVDVQRLDKTE